ncbi:hypothetical protein [Nocardia salmonicida]|uniref:hypothetical protein n=1 Tax=Nocardia salmonicida TaxID=53431 RepID=UPI0036392823
MKRTRQAKKGRALAAALRPKPEQQQDMLGLLFNVDEHGHEYSTDLLDLAATASR